MPKALLVTGIFSLTIWLFISVAAFAQSCKATCETHYGDNEEMAAACEVGCNSGLDTATSILNQLRATGLDGKKTSVLPYIT